MFTWTPISVAVTNSLFRKILNNIVSGTQTYLTDVHPPFSFDPRTSAGALYESVLGSSWPGLSMMCALTHSQVHQISMIAPLRKLALLRGNTNQPSN